MLRVGPSTDTASMLNLSRPTPRALLRCCLSLAVFATIAVGCETPNNPYRDADADKVIFYTDFNSPPKTLDPAVSYSSEEAEILGLVVEPPLTYHYLRRPYEVVPLTATEVPQGKHTVWYPVGFDPNADASGSGDGDTGEAVATEPHTVNQARGEGAFGYLKAWEPLAAATEAGLADAKAAWDKLMAMSLEGETIAEETLTAAEAELVAVAAALEDVTAALGAFNTLGYAPGTRSDVGAAIDTLRAVNAWIAQDAAKTIATRENAAAALATLALTSTLEALDALPAAPAWMSQARKYRVYYDITIQKGILYQDHPCFATDDKGRYLYHTGHETNVLEYSKLVRAQRNPNLTQAERDDALSKLEAKGNWASEDDIRGVWDVEDFHNGKMQAATRELHAKDFVYQIRRWADPLLHAPPASMLGRYFDGFDAYMLELEAERDAEREARREIAGALYNQDVDEKDSPLRLDYLAHDLPGARVVDDYTFRLTLVEPYPQLQYWMCMPFFAPAPWEATAFFEQGAMKSHDLTMRRFPVGTGALRMSVYDRNREIRLVRNENYNRKTANDGAAPPAVVDANGNGKLDAGEIYWWDRNGNGTLDRLDDWGELYEGFYFADDNGNLTWDAGESWYESPGCVRTIYPLTGDPEDAEAGYLTDAGKRLPFIDGYVLRNEKEAIPRWNKFLQGYYDRSVVLADTFDSSIKMTATDAELSPELQAQGVGFSKMLVMSNRYWAFNMADPTIGGYTEDKRKLRRAISIAFNVEEWIEIFVNGRGEAAQGPLVPGIYGGPELIEVPGGRVFRNEEDINTYVYDAVPYERNGKVIGYKPQRKSLDEAKRLLAEAGWPNGRRASDGKPLVVNFDQSWTSAGARSQLEWCRKQFKRLNIELDLKTTDYPRFQHKVDDGAHQFIFWGWNADYPDAENFMFLLYGPNNSAPIEGHPDKGGPNSSLYNSPEYNAAFKKLETMSNTPERLQRIREATEIARRDAPWIWGYYSEGWTLAHQWYENDKPNLMTTERAKFRRIDAERRADLRAKWNEPNWDPVLITLGILVALTLPAAFVMWWRERRPSEA